VLDIGFFSPFRQAFEKKKSQKTEELVAQLKHLSELASTRRCPAAGMDHIRTMLDDTNVWIKNCFMDRPYLDAVSKTKV